MNPLLFILGPTASGKTRLATRIASQINGAILSVDSRQIYRGMNIGTGKDLNEYVVDGHSIPYHLIDIADAGDKYNVSLFKHDFQSAYLRIKEEGKVAVACGGTGFYFHTLLKSQGYTEVPVDEILREKLEKKTNEELLAFFHQLVSTYHERADTSTRKRLIRAIEIAVFLTQNPDAEEEINSAENFEYHPLIFGLSPPAEIRRERISSRLSYRLAHGMIEEVESLLRSGLDVEQLIYYGLEYKYITEYLLKRCTYEEMATKLETEIHRFAKRQMTFFRKMEKDGIKIHWLDYATSENEHIQQVIQHYNKFVQDQES